MRYIRLFSVFIGCFYILFASPSTPEYVTRIELIGVKALNKGQIKKLLRTKERGIFAKKEFDRRVLKLDALSVKNYYLSYGYLGVTVKDSFNIKEDGIEVFLIVNEGKQYFLKSVTIEGNKTINGKDIKDILKFKENKPYDPVTANTNISDLEEKYQQFGKLFAYIEISDQIRDSVDVLIRIVEGPDIYINKFYIEGLEQLDSTIVMREIILKKGDLYSKDKIDKTRRRLMETGIYSFVNFTPLKINKSDTTVNILIELRQFKRREWISEGGYYPDEYYEGAEELPGIGGEIEWRNRSFFHSTTSFSTHLTGHIPLEQELTYPKVRYDLGFGNQWIASFRIPTKLELYYETFKHYSYTSKPTIHRYGVQLTNTYRFTERSFFETGLRWEKFLEPEGIFEDKDIEQRSYNISTYLDGSDNPLFPKTGFIITADASQTGGFLGGNRDFVKFDVGISNYLRIIKNLVLASRIKYGMIFGWNESYEDIRYDKFYLGGSTSLRGWETLRFEEQTVIDNEGKETSVPIGRTIRIMTNFELRFPLFWLLGGEIFIDGGYLTSEFKQVSIPNLAWDTGAGLTVSTALGPIRLDYAYPVDAPADWKLQLGVHYIF